MKPPLPRPVLTKHDFVRRYAKGEFGNASPTWDDIQDLGDSEYDGLVHIRNRVAGGPTWYNIPSFPDAGEKWFDLTEDQGVDPASLYISAMAPTEKTLFQGEVIQGLKGLDLTYTTVAKPMRDALREQTNNAQGIRALTLLRHFLCSRSWDWMVYLLDAYLDHAIEFSTYSVNWGTLPGYNTVFWEVRLY